LQAGDVSLLDGGSELLQRHGLRLSKLGDGGSAQFGKMRAATQPLTKVMSERPDISPA